MEPTAFGVLRAEVAGVVRFDLPVGLLLPLGLLQRLHLRFGEDQPVLRYARLQGLQALLEGLQVVPQPHAAHARRGDAVALLA